MNHYVESLGAQVHVNDEFRPCKFSHVVSEECEIEIHSVTNGLVCHIRHSQQVTQFIFADHSRLPSPAPPPKLHYSTWWRSITRRIYQANVSSGIKKQKADMQGCVPASKN
jgi:hypothetical protein